MHRSRTTTRSFSASALLALVPAGRLLVAVTVTAGMWLAPDPLPGRIRSSSAPAPPTACSERCPSQPGHRPSRDRDRRRLHPDRDDEHRAGDHRGVDPVGNAAGEHQQCRGPSLASSQGLGRSRLGPRARASQLARGCRDRHRQRDGSVGSAFSATLSDESFAVLNTVVDGINQAPANLTNGEGPASGEAVQITVTFTPPIVLPADHLFRPEVGDRRRFPVPVDTEAARGAGDALDGDLQAWIRNADLKPDWLRIGTDIIGGTPVTFNMAVSLAGETVSQAQTPTAIATATPTTTPTVRRNNDDGGGCSIGAGP